MYDLQMERPDGTPIDWDNPKGYSNYLVSTDGDVYSEVSDKFIVQYLSDCGYKRVDIYTDSGKRKHVPVHRLVYLAHVGEIPKGMQINHKDENKTNNRLDNLELVTPKENRNYGTGPKRRIDTYRKTMAERQKRKMQSA